MRELTPAFIRTLVPIVFGPVLTRFGMDITDPDTLLMVSGATSYAFYVLVRVIEEKYPMAGWMLGIAKRPAYSPKAAPSPGAGEEMQVEISLES